MSPNTSRPPYLNTVYKATMLGKGGLPLQNYNRVFFDGQAVMLFLGKIASMSTRHVFSTLEADSQKDSTTNSNSNTLCDLACDSPRSAYQTFRSGNGICPSPKNLTEVAALSLACCPSPKSFCPKLPFYCTPLPKKNNSIHKFPMTKLHQPTSPSQGTQPPSWSCQSRWWQIFMCMYSSSITSISSCYFFTFVKLRLFLSTFKRARSSEERKESKMTPKWSCDRECARYRCGRIY